jgi:uncharacterized integral membrane protein
MEDERSEARSTEKRAARKLRSAKPLLAVLLAGVVLVLVFQNQEPVRTQFLLWQMEMPRFFLLAVIYLLGVVTGWIAFWRSRRPSQ